MRLTSKKPVEGSGVSGQPMRRRCERRLVGLRMCVSYIMELLLGLRLSRPPGQLSRNIFKCAFADVEKHINHMY